MAPVANAATTPNVGWAITLAPQPASFSEKDSGTCLSGTEKYCDRYTLVITNVGARASSGTVTVTVKLPPGLTTYQTPFPVGSDPKTNWSCSPEGQGSNEVTCATNDSISAFTAASPLFVPVEVESGASESLVSEAQVVGGVAGCGEAGEPACPRAEVTANVTLDGAIPQFEPTNFMAAGFDPSGIDATEAGGRPGSLLTTFAFPTILRSNPIGGILPRPVGDAKQIVVDLPAGVVGNPEATPKCALSDLADFANCSPAAQVGLVTVLQPAGAQTQLPLFNVVPEYGYAAEFGVFDPTLGRAILLYARLRPYPDYNIEVVSAPQDRFLEDNGVITTVFGNPVAKTGAPITQIPFFTNPSNCSTPSFTTDVYVDSWQRPGATLPDGRPDLSDAAGWRSASAQSPAVTGCGSLVFQPQFSFGPEPTHSHADEPSGYRATLMVPQDEDPHGRATPPVRTVTTTLPAGVAISPSAANGLVGCQESGEEGINLESPDKGNCPAGSSIGTVEVTTPLLQETLQGNVYVAQPSCGGAGQPVCTEEAAETGGIFALYIEVRDESRGIYLKLKGKVEVGGAGHRNGLSPGEVRTTFTDAPQEPFNQLTLSFRSGPRAPLANPDTCGTFSTVAEIEPWSHTPAPSEELGTPNATLNPLFSISGCQNAFSPAFSAGTINQHAAAFTPFTVTLKRKDREGLLSGVTVKTPPGLLGKIAGVPRCSEEQANGGTCPAASRLGSVTAAAGSGPEPFWQTGSAYLTGPYHGAPFGLSIVVPAKAGPFNLGNIVVRAAIRVDPTTAQITVASNPLPQMIDGVPLRIKDVNVTIDRPDFMLNPTSCESLQVEARLESTLGAVATPSSRFQAADCAALPFKPSFSAGTEGRTSKANGASLHVMLVQRSGEANIRKVDVSLPAALPSRQVTLTKACTERQFAQDPNGCPPASDVGFATVRTPLLNVPLTGQVYLVSHGGAAFPDVDIVLKGEGITIDLVGKTDIKKGITYSRFDSAPDAPFTAFDLTLPEKRYSLLGTFRNLCKLQKVTTVHKLVAVHRHGHVVHVRRAIRHVVAEKLIMPTKLTGQNGAVISRNTTMSVTGCAKSGKAKPKRHKTGG
jgi:hypothetical protein